MSFADEAPPLLSESVIPPNVHGPAALTTRAYREDGYESLIAAINQSCDHEAARIYDTAIACQLSFRRAEGLNLQDEALARSQMFRIGGRTLRSDPLRVLALLGPGDLMVNTPLDFITNHLNVRLDLLYLLPDQPLPPKIPEHDVALFATGDTDAPGLQRLQRLFDAWPRPALNNPKFLPLLARDALSRCLAEVPGICSPTAIAVTREAVEAHLQTGRPIAGFDTAQGPYPCLIRPSSSHAGIGLALARTQAELADYLRLSFERRFFVTAFEDYRDPDGGYRKSRIAFVDRRPFLCHMAISQNWMVHYLNAGMTESAAKRDEEARAMAMFDDGFARRHAGAFAALHQRLGFDYYSIDCAETRDGRLLVFEADTAAIIHLMDPPDLFPYKAPQMHRVFTAVGAMLEGRAGRTRVAAGRGPDPVVGQATSTPAVHHSAAF